MTKRKELDQLGDELRNDFKRSSIIGKSKAQVEQSRKRLNEIAKRIMILTKEEYS